MKKNILLTALMVFGYCWAMYAQNNRVSYQAVVRDSTNHLVVETPLTVNLVLTDSLNHTYSESHSVTSNPNGLISLWIGDGNAPSGNWNDLVWNKVTVESKIYRQSDGKHIVTHSVPIAAVPYALYAEDVSEEILISFFDEAIISYFEEHPFTQKNADWNATGGVEEILHKPIIPVVNDGQLNITLDEKIWTFTANQDTNTTLNIDVVMDSIVNNFEDSIRELKQTINNLELTINNLEQTIHNLEQTVNNIDQRLIVVEQTISGGFVCGDKVQDFEGNWYETVEIASQCWMKTSMRAKVDSAGNGINAATELNTEKNYYLTDRNDSIYGYLYNWSAAKCVCPKGWHLPRVEEWELLTEYLVANYKCNEDDSFLAKALASTSGWDSTSAILSTDTCKVAYMQSTTNNATGFSAYPAGERNSTGVVNVGGESDFWLYKGSGSTCRFLENDQALISSVDGVDQTHGLSVRCIRN